MIRGCLCALLIMILFDILILLLVAIVQLLPYLAIIGPVVWIAYKFLSKGLDKRRSEGKSEGARTESTAGSGPHSSSESGKRQQWERRQRCKQEEDLRRERENRHRQEGERERERQRRREQEEELRRDQEKRHRQKRERRRRREQESRREGGRQRERRAGQYRSQTRVEDYYARLGVEATATPNEVKSAWKKFAREWHPDVCIDPNAEKVFQAGNQAYEVLSVPEERQKYDAQLRRQMQEKNRRAEAQRHSGASQGQSQRASRRATRSAGQYNRSHSTEGAYRRRHEHSRGNSGRLFSGTWTKIRSGPLAGTWGVWIDSLYVMEGERALIQRRDGHQSLVVIIQILRRSPANRVTLCRVQNM